MILGENREAVIGNIAAAAREQRFHDKVEVSDPVLSPEEKSAVVERWLSRRRTPGFRLKTLAGRWMANMGTALLNRDTEIVGLEKVRDLGGAVLTSNHFSPLDNTVIRHLTRKLHKKRISIVSQLTNFAMTGAVGFLMNYADTIPLGEDPEYLLHRLPEILRERTEEGEWVLIYPEKEMWFNYRKPRPLLRGAYHFAVRLNVPVVSCFVEMTDREEEDVPGFKKVRYTLHILDVLYPDPGKSLRENSIDLCHRDYELKKAAYEQIYGRALHYDFDPGDIAGWMGAQP